MNYLTSSPLVYQDWNIEKSKKNTDLDNEYYISKKVFTKNDVCVYKNIICKSIYNLMTDFKKDICWKFDYLHDKKLILDKDTDEISLFSADVSKNFFFTNLFYHIILPQIEIKNKENVKIDELFITGQLHGLSSLFHKDFRSSKNYGPTVYILLNNNWKSYYDGNLCFLLNPERNTVYHIENTGNKVIVFPPDMYHRFGEVSGYGLIENAMNIVVQYHLIYI